MATWRVLVDPQAAAEARDSFLWYLERNPAAARGFQAAVDEAIDSLAEAPYRWPEIEPGIRRRLLNRFPYSMLYSMDEHTVTVLAIMHHKRHPNAWKAAR